MTRQTFAADHGFYGRDHINLTNQSLTANTPGERHDAAVTVADQLHTGRLHHRDDVLTVLQALGLIDYRADHDTHQVEVPRRIQRAPFSDAEIHTMLTLHERGESNNAIAKRLGAAESTVRRRIQAYKRRNQPAA